MEAMAIMEHSLNQTMSKGLKLTVSGRCRVRGLTAQFSTHEHTVDNLNYHLHKHKKLTHME